MARLLQRPPQEKGWYRLLFRPNICHQPQFRIEEDGTYVNDCLAVNSAPSAGNDLVIHADDFSKTCFDGDSAGSYSISMSKESVGSNEENIPGALERRTAADQTKMAAQETRREVK